MKYANLIAKLLAAAAAIAGVVYVIATYGDKIVAWAKSILPTCEADEDEDIEEVVEDVAEEAAEAVEEVAEAVEEAVEEAAEVAEEAVVAEEADFEG